LIPLRKKEPLFGHHGQLNNYHANLLAIFYPKPDIVTDYPLSNGNS